MELDELVDELINKLDSKKDYFLIELLNQKIRDINQEYLLKHLFTDYELNRAKRGGHRTLETFMKRDVNMHKDEIKILKIDERTLTCKNCKFAKTEVWSRGYVHYSPHSNERCIRCGTREQQLLEIQQAYIDAREKRIDDIQQSERFKEIWECKTVIIKLQNRLRNFIIHENNKNHDAS